MKPHVFPMICVKKRCSNNQVHTSAIASQFTRLNTSSMATWDECQPLFTVWLLNETARDMQTISRCHYNHQSTTPSKTPSKPFFRHQPLTTWKSRPGLTNSGPMSLIDFTCYPTADAFRCDQFTAGDLLLCIHIETFLKQHCATLVVVFSTHLFWRWNIISEFSKKKKKGKFQTYSNFPTPFHMTQLRIPNSWVVERWRVETTRQNNGCRKGILNLVCSFYGLLHE